MEFKNILINLSSIFKNNDEYFQIILKLIILNGFINIYGYFKLYKSIKQIVLLCNNYKVYKYI